MGNVAVNKRGGGSLGTLEDTQATHRNVFEFLHVRYKIVTNACHGARQRHTTDEEDKHEHVGEECREVHHLSREESIRGAKVCVSPSAMMRILPLNGL